MESVGKPKVSLSLAGRAFVRVDSVANRRDSAEEPRISIDRFGIISPNKRKFRMHRVEDDIAPSPVDDNTWCSKDRSSSLLNPSISESSGGDHILGVPVFNLFDGHIAWNDNANHTMVL